LLKAALRRLATKGTDNQEKIAAGGGVEVVLAAMQQHLADDGVQDAACGALAHLAANNLANQQAIAAGTVLFSP
jgi:hypothetical protein